MWNGVCSGRDIGAYVHIMQTSFYFAGVAGLVSMVTSLRLLRRLFGVRNPRICPGPVRVSAVVCGTLSQGYGQSHDGGRG